MHRVLATVLLPVSSALAYMVTFPGDSQGWNTTGPNYLDWQRVNTDPLNFTAVLTNVGTTSDQVMDTLVDGTVGTVLCNPPSGGWPSGSGFRVNLVQDPQHLDTILAQSSEFNITAVSSGGSTTSSAPAQTASSTVTATTSLTSGVSSSDTSTSPTGVSAASLGADTRAGLLTAVAALTAFITALF